MYQEILSSLVPESVCPGTSVNSFPQEMLETT